MGAKSSANIVRRAGLRHRVRQIEERITMTPDQELKSRLLKSAQCGWSRPRDGTTFAELVDGWLDRESPSYDPDFEYELRERNPSWLDTGDSKLVAPDNPRSSPGGRG